MAYTLLINTNKYMHKRSHMDSDHGPQMQLQPQHNGFWSHHMGIRTANSGRHQPALVLNSAKQQQSQYNSQPKPELAATIGNSNIIISTKAIHHKLAPNPELDFEELQLTKLNPHRLIHPQMQGNIPNLLQLLLQ